jgi:hypothetical protein
VSTLPSTTKTAQPNAAQTLTPFLAIVSKTGWASFGELPMTRRISAVAVSRANASFSDCCTSGDDPD